ncbi:Fe-S cluster assembly protein SufD [Haloglycomyces albus]|uniref:Fe-S cluster assembly protein SufD n=1 Tax=Haloglycomyces albus TaxID=526067 RepID=UPI00046D252E|nr:Fe-S cluster assembly protein SufD [Haloglycomyces albus]
MSIELASRPHSHGAGSEKPPKTKSQALRSFRAADFPELTGREEDWRFTPVKRLAGLDQADTPTATTLDRQAENLPTGVKVETIAKDDPRLGGILTPFERTSALAWEKSSDALLVSIEGTVDETVVLDVTGQGNDGANYAHMYLDVAEEASATVIMRHTGSVTLSDNIEINVGNHAELSLTSIVEWDRDSVHLQHQKARLGDGAKLNHLAVTLGGDLVRHFLTVDYAGRGADVDAYGLYFADGGQHLEHRQLVDHAVADCRSNVNYRGALQGQEAHTVWVGDVLIEAEATGTDTYEINRNLILTDGARADSVPNLEIETGEIVSAGHASATGRFDEEHLFYLRSRGIPEDEARRLVVQGFFNEILVKVPNEELREHLISAVMARLDEAQETR